MNSNLFGQIMRWAYSHNGFTWSELRIAFPALSDESQNRYMHKLLLHGTDIHPPLLEKFGTELREDSDVLYFTRLGIEIAANHLAQEGAARVSRWALFIAILAVAMPIITNLSSYVCAIMHIEI